MSITSSPLLKKTVKIAPAVLFVAAIVSSYNPAQALSLNGHCKNWMVASADKDPTRTQRVCREVAGSDTVTAYDPRSQSCLICAKSDWVPNAVNSVKDPVNDAVRSSEGLCADPLPSQYTWAPEKMSETIRHCAELGLKSIGWLPQGSSCGENDNSRTGYEIDHEKICERSYPGRYVDWCYAAKSIGQDEYKYNPRCIVRK